MMPAPAASPPSSFMQDELDFGLFTIYSPSLTDLSLSRPTFIAECRLPFSWTHSIDFSSITRSLSSSQQLVKWKAPSKMQLDAVFHSSHQPLVDTTYGSHGTTLPLYVITSLVNSVSSASHATSNDAYALLKALPLSEISRSLKALPAPILDAFKERVFATAVKVGDLDLVSTMLELNMDPREQIMMDWPSRPRPTYPLQFSIVAGHFAVAKTLTSHMCRGATQSQLDEVVNHISEGEEFRNWHFKFITLSESERTQLMCIILNAGARPNCKYLRGRGYNVSVASLKQLIEATTTGIIEWLDMGLLAHYFTEINAPGSMHPYDQGSLAKDVLRFVLFDCQHLLPTEDPRPKTAILDALHVALRPHNERAVEVILEAFSLLGYRLDDQDIYECKIGAPGFTHGLILEAFDNADWELAASSMIAKKSMGSTDKAQTIEQQKSELDAALEKNDLRLAFSMYTTMDRDNDSSSFGYRMVQLAINLQDSSMVIKIIECMENCFHYGMVGLVVLLEHGHITTVSTILTGCVVWKSALEAASGHNNYGALESIFFHGMTAPFTRVGKGTHIILTPMELQLGFRAVAYHAMAMDDFQLCKWLFQLGMDPDDFQVSWDNDSLRVKKVSSSHSCFPGGISTVYLDDRGMLPSLLAVAAEKSHIEWMKFLATEGVSVVDSMALLRAFKSRATDATIHFLLDAAKAMASPVQRNYGVAALRQVIRYRDITRIDLLCGVVNVDGIEHFNEEFVNMDPAISPLGEAIIANDPGIVRVLLDHGANPNAYVSFDGLHMLEHVKSHLERVTPLLAAIDVRSLPLVKMLVENGAELQYTRNMGIARTPLQRAAETGSFDIVEYLVDQGAIIDTIPVYSGGTALQLASMNGFCGIAALLLERGANPNYPPAKGDGITAFEAAAEWGHIDTMSLLMQWNVDLDAQFGEPPESQYERARRFAEKNGFMASKRFVEHLYRQRTVDQNWDGEFLEFMGGISG
jgi:ankyrin repeat protein